jgi:hypothetical protein
MWALTLPQVAATLVGYNTLNANGERLLTAENIQRGAGAAGCYLGS